MHNFFKLYFIEILKKIFTAQSNYCKRPLNQGLIFTSYPYPGNPLVFISAFFQYN